MKNNKVSSVWVLGHSGIKGNEDTNTLARNGEQTPLTGPEPLYGMVRCTSFQDVLPELFGSQQEQITPPHWHSYKTLSPWKA